MTAYKTTFKDYRYDFTLHGKRYTKSGFKSKREALLAQEIARKKISMMSPLKNKQYVAQKFSADHSDTLEIDKFTALKEKYQAFLTNPFCVLPDLIDLIFDDFELGYTFSDLREIVLKNKHAKIPAKIRINVFKRDDYKCVLCGAAPPEAILHADHIVPVSRGGLTDMRNLRTLCRSCNLGKSGLPYHVAG